MLSPKWLPLPLTLKLGCIATAFMQIPTALTTSWSTSAPDPSLHLPPPNPYIATDFTVKGLKQYLPPAAAQGSNGAAKAAKTNGVKRGADRRSKGQSSRDKDNSDNSPPPAMVPASPPPTSASDTKQQAQASNNHKVSANSRSNSSGTASGKGANSSADDAAASPAAQAAAAAAAEAAALASQLNLPLVLATQPHMVLDEPGGAVQGHNQVVQGCARA